VPWVRLAQRVPVRIEFDSLPQDNAGFWYNLQRRYRPALMNLSGLIQAKLAVD
jgi:hypothetical protein